MVQQQTTEEQLELNDEFWKGYDKGRRAGWNAGYRDGYREAREMSTITVCDLRKSHGK